MAKGSHLWTEQEEKVVVDKVVEAIRKGRRKDMALIEAAVELGRTHKAVRYRYYAILKFKYEELIDQEERERISRINYFA